MTSMQLECFLAVAETLSFAKAAGQLNVTQPAVTQQIQALEEELNVRLFRRTTRMVRLTQEGHVFFDDARSILRIIHYTKKRFQEHSTKDSLPFIIGCHGYDELELLPDVLKEMTKTYPDLHPLFQVIPFQHIYHLLAEEMVDVVLSFEEKEEKESYGTYREFTKIPVVCVTAADHPLAARPSLTVRELSDERIILVAPQKAPRSLNAIQRELTKDKSIADVLLCDAPAAGLLLAKAGLGIVVLPSLLAGKDPALCRIPLEAVRPLSYGAYYKSPGKKPLLKLFLKLCREQFAN